MSLEGRVLENTLMHAALDAARIGLCVIASDGHIVVLGGDVAEKLGTTSALLLGRHFRGLFAAGLALNAGTELFSLDAPETSTEARFTHTNGTVTLLLLQGRTVTVADNDRYRVLTVVDISNFGITRGRLLELRRQLDAINSAVVIVDARSSDLPVVYLNKRFEHMTGYPADFVVGRNCRFLQGADRNQPGARKLADAIERRQPCHVLLRNFRRDGSAFVNDLFISPLFDEAGELTYYIGVQRECSGRTALSFATGLAG